MIYFGNRKKILVDTSFREIAKTRSLLKENNIEFEVKTKRNSNGYIDNVNADIALDQGMSFSSVQGEVTFVYFVYVKRKDFEKAKKILGI